MKTFDLVYNSNSKQRIHSRVWKEPPAGLIKARLSKIVQDREKGTITVDIIGTCSDGFRMVEQLQPGSSEKVPVQVPKYKIVTAQKVIKAIGVIKKNIKLKMADA